MPYDYRAIVVVTCAPCVAVLCVDTLRSARFGADLEIERGQSDCRPVFYSVRKSGIDLVASGAFDHTSCSFRLRIDDFSVVFDDIFYEIRGGENALI